MAGQVNVTPGRMQRFCTWICGEPEKEKKLTSLQKQIVKAANLLDLNLAQFNENIEEDANDKYKPVRDLSMATAIIKSQVVNINRIQTEVQDIQKQLGKRPCEQWWCPTEEGAVRKAYSTTQYLTSFASAGLFGAGFKSDVAESTGYFVAGFTVATVAGMLTAFDKYLATKVSEYDKNASSVSNIEKKVKKSLERAQGMLTLYKIISDPPESVSMINRSLSEISSPIKKKVDLNKVQEVAERNYYNSPKMNERRLQNLDVKIPQSPNEFSIPSSRHPASLPSATNRAAHHPSGIWHPASNTGASHPRSSIPHSRSDDKINLARRTHLKEHKKIGLPPLHTGPQDDLKRQPDENRAHLKPSPHRARHPHISHSDDELHERRPNLSARIDERRGVGLRPLDVRGYNMTSARSPQHKSPPGNRSPRTPQGDIKLGSPSATSPRPPRHSPPQQRGGHPTRTSPHHHTSATTHAAPRQLRPSQSQGGNERASNNHSRTSPVHAGANTGDRGQAPVELTDIVIYPSGDSEIVPKSSPERKRV